MACDPMRRNAASSYALAAASGVLNGPSLSCPLLWGQHTVTAYFPGPRRYTPLNLGPSPPSPPLAPVPPPELRSAALAAPAAPEDVRCFLKVPCPARFCFGRATAGPAPGARAAFFASAFAAVLRAATSWSKRSRSVRQRGLRLPSTKLTAARL